MQEGENIKANIRKMQNGSFVSELKEKTSQYRNGAIIGGVIGLGCSLFVLKGKRWFLCTGIGVLGGGYLASILTEKSENSKNIKIIKN